MTDLTRRASLATLVTLPAVTAAAPVTTLDRRRSVVSVAEFGAVGDGVTDDTEAFRLALLDAMCVQVPSAMRHYRITRTLSLQRRGQRLVGSGLSSRIVLDPVDRFQGNLLVIERDDTDISGLTLVPAHATDSLFEGWAIAVIGARRATIRDCCFSGMLRGGILLSDSEDCLVSGNTFTDGTVRGDGSEPQSATGYDILAAGASSRNVIERNRCFSGVGTAIGCQTVTPGKSQRNNTIRDNIISGYPCYGIMAYLSAPDDRIEGVYITGNHVENISGSIRTIQNNIFYGCGIYIQSCNDLIVTGNRIFKTNTDRRKPFSGSAVPAAIGISGYGNGIVSGNIIDECHHGIASIQTTAQPRPNDGTTIADNSIRGCDGAGIWLPDAVAAIVHSNRLTAAPGKGTHGILIRCFASKWMSGFSLRGNIIDGFAVGVEVGGDGVPSAEIASNHIRATSGNGIYSSATTTVIHNNDVSAPYGVTLSKGAVRGVCKDNVITASRMAITDDGGSGVRVENNIVPEGASFATSVAQTLGSDAKPTVSAKRWFRKTEGATIMGLRGGYEGQVISILADASFTLKSGAILLRDRADRIVEEGALISLALIEGVWREIA